ncbi:hypothetical protein [Inconstantimicrobium mannanitabidum]|uniref:Uncharacterized protein n=1 Tax=Inconstantimicrobium mannanitabidum TaxID=1604901 RepID=A0ACB5RDC4_9CLOT|nr:hypothetical protein [Clostridium sp. TW13]GKX67167.1 hypothetical protein rsdtw13_24250 [Clostridium sp. TW13]
MNYKMADMNEAEIKAIQKAEESLKAETGKDFILLAVEPDDKKK